MKIKIKEISKEELVDLFSTATYGNDYFDIKRYKSDRGLVKEESDCIEETWADIILGGGKLAFVDVEDESHKDIDLKMLLKGLEKCFKECPSSINNFVDIEEGSFDMWDAYNICQVIMYGEVVYG